ncbi:hypothetical protein CpB1087 [Chlamydia pneumoniae TW-183]|uniref:Uncharacterized protein n=1 Tax=Chlamydia pneumoniae TaxID=83558 RepID=A0ABN3YQN9_CHLPN|nr:hypothetical protein CpB1087 [Chlamydia pneumoniae TW-183]
MNCLSTLPNLTDGPIDAKNQNSPRLKFCTRSCVIAAPYIPNLKIRILRRKRSLYLHINDPLSF